jgi:hypothetical protein
MTLVVDLVMDGAGVPKSAVERSAKCQPHPATATITITEATASCTTTTIEMKKDHHDR